MPHIDEAVLSASNGFIFLADPGTVIPTTVLLGSYVPEDDDHFPGYESLGHLSREDLPSLGFDGGDTEVQGTWSNSVFREVVTDPATDFITFNALQFDEQVLSLYYGQADTVASDGKFIVQNAPTTTISKALYMVIIDGPRRVAFHAPAASLRREAAIELATDAFSSFPLRATFLKMSGQPLFQWDGVSNVPAP